MNVFFLTQTIRNTIVRTVFGWLFKRALESVEKAFDANENCSNSFCLGTFDRIVFVYIAESELKTIQRPSDRSRFFGKLLLSTIAKKRLGSLLNTGRRRITQADVKIKNGFSAEPQSTGAAVVIAVDGRRIIT